MHGLVPTSTDNSGARRGDRRRLHGESRPAYGRPRTCWTRCASRAASRTTVAIRRRTAQAYGGCRVVQRRRRTAYITFRCSTPRAPAVKMTSRPTPPRSRWPSAATSARCRPSRLGARRACPELRRRGGLVVDHRQPQAVVAFPPASGRAGRRLAVPIVRSSGRPAARDSSSPSSTRTASSHFHSDRGQRPGEPDVETDQEPRLQSRSCRAAGAFSMSLPGAALRGVCHAGASAAGRSSRCTPSSTFVPWSWSGPSWRC